jgi:biotin carboxyl carrier protein
MKKSIIAVVLIGLVGTVFLILSKSHDVEFDEIEIIKEEQAPVTVYKLPVIGTAKSSADIIIYAKTFGEVIEMPIRRGDIVAERSFLLSSTNPVLDTEYSSVSFAEIIRGLEYEKQVNAMKSNEFIHVTSLDEQKSLVSLSLSSNANRVEEVSASITASLKEVRSIVPEILRFYQDSRTSLSAESVEMLQEVSSELYGDTPQYLRINNVISSSYDNGIFKIMERASDKEQVELIPRLLFVMHKISVAHSKSEKNFYTEFSQSDTHYINYISNVEKIYGIIKKLQSDHERWRELLDAQSSENIQRNSEVTRQNMRLNDSQIQLKILEDIQDASMNLSQSNMQRVAEEMRLGIILAPYKGTITETYVNVGSIVQRGTPVARLTTTEAKETHLTIPYEVASTLSVGDNLYSEDSIIGTIRTISNLRKGKTVEVIVDLEANIIVDQTVRGEFRIDTNVLPELKIVRRSDIFFKQNNVYIQKNSSSQELVKIISDSGNLMLVSTQ